eukprot:m.229071 g.229071  ORF g.229071 m.229071 type:complete len:246 (-) comp33552_c1_seq2:207-944(-)
MVHQHVHLSERYREYVRTTMWCCHKKRRTTKKRQYKRKREEQEQEEQEQGEKEKEKEDVYEGSLINRVRSPSVVRSGYSIPVENSQDFDESDYAPIIHDGTPAYNNGVVVGATVPATKAADFDHYTTSNDVRQPLPRHTDYHQPAHGTANINTSDSKAYYSLPTARYLLTEGSNPSAHHHAYETPPNVKPAQARKLPTTKQPQQELVYDANVRFEDDDNTDEEDDTLEQYSQVSTLRRDRSGSRV